MNWNNRERVGLVIGTAGSLIIVAATHNFWLFLGTDMMTLGAVIFWSEPN